MVPCNLERANEFWIPFYGEILGYGSSFVCQITKLSNWIRELYNWSRKLFNTIRELFNSISALSNYTYIESSSIELKSPLIELKSSPIELDSSLIQLESSLNIWDFVNMVFHTDVNYIDYRIKKTTTLFANVWPHDLYRAKRKRL